MHFLGLNLRHLGLALHLQLHVQSFGLHIASGLRNLALACVLGLQNGGLTLLGNGLSVGQFHLGNVLLDADIQLLLGFHLCQLQLGFGGNGRFGQILLTHLQDRLQHIVAKVSLLGQHNAHNQELGDHQAVFLEAFLKGSEHCCRQPHLLLIQLQDIQLFGCDDIGQIGGNRQLNHAAEIVLKMTFPVFQQVLPGQLAAGAHQLQQELTGICNPEVQHAPGADGNGCTGGGLQEVDLLRSSPLDGHLVDQIDEIDLRVEGTLGIGRQGVQLFQNGQLLGLQSVPACAEEVQSLTIPEEDGLLRFVDDQLGA